MEFRAPDAPPALVRGLVPSEAQDCRMFGLAVTSLLPETMTKTVIAYPIVGIHSVGDATPIWYWAYISTTYMCLKPTSIWHC